MTEKKEFVAAEAFPPAEYIRDAIKSRGWSKRDFTAIWPSLACSADELLAGDVHINGLIATWLGQLFGTSAEYWLNLQKMWTETEGEGNDADQAGQDD